MAEVVFFSNYLNHHQLSFCEEMVRLTDNNFYFVAQKAISEKRIAFGYQNITEKYPFVVKTYKSEAELKKAYELAIEADYVLFGSSNTDYLKQRLRNNQLTIKYSERMFRNKMNLFGSEAIEGYTLIIQNIGISVYICFVQDCMLPMILIVLELTKARHINGVIFLRLSIMN